MQGEQGAEECCPKGKLGTACAALRAISDAEKESCGVLES
jgi:hypothetical protein